VLAIFASTIGLAVPRHAAALPADRGWELVSPIDKNGGEIAAPGELAGGGALQAAADGNSVTYGSATSFGVAPQGAPPASQYLSIRSAGGWSTANLTTPILSGTYAEDEGSPYRLFAFDLGRGLLLNGKHCRGEAEAGCPVANPPLPGTDAPAGYQNYYLRETSNGAFDALLGPAELSHTSLDASELSIAFAGASDDLLHLVLSSCAALTADATEAPGSGGCDESKPNLYLWEAGALELLNSAPGAELAAPARAVSNDGTRVYWTDLVTGDLQLRDGAATEQVDAAAGGGGTFETASVDGGVAFFTKEGHLWRYAAATESATDLTPAGGVLGVLGASADGESVYYLTAAGLFLRKGAVTTKAAATADASNYPPASGTARVTPDGNRIAFVSTTSLTGYNNLDQKTSLPDSQVYVYDATTLALRCASCRPTGTRPIGPSQLPGATQNGAGPAAVRSYKPRALSADGKRLFFDSRDAVLSSDTNNDWDVYQWEAQGSGSCGKVNGCVDLISSGRSEGGASFVDASASGADAFFLTDGSLVGSDPGAVDLYDARVGGGFPEPLAPIPCVGDSCQVLPSEPIDPALSTLFVGPGNPAVRYYRYKRRNHKKCRRAERQAGKCRGKKQGKRQTGKGGAAARGARR